LKSNLINIAHVNVANTYKLELGILEGEYARHLAYNYFNGLREIALYKAFLKTTTKGPTCYF